MSELKEDQEPSIEEILESIRQIISEDGEGGANPAKESKDKDVPLSLTPEKETAVSASKLDLSAEKRAAGPKPAEVVLKSPPPPSKDKDVSLSLSPNKEAATAASNLDLSSKKEAATVASNLDLSAKVASAEAASTTLDMSVLDLTEQVNPVKAAARPQPSPPEMAIEMMDNPITDNKPMTADTPPTDTLISAQAAAAAIESLSKLLASNIAVEKDDVSQVGKVTLEDITRELMKPMIKTWLDQNLPQVIEKIVQREVEKLSRRALDR